MKGIVALVSAFCLCLFCVSVEAAKLSPSALEGINKSLSAKGMVSVLIEYESPLTSAQSLSSLKGEARVAALNTMRRSFLTSLTSSTAATVVRQYQYLPGLLSNVNADQLAELRASKYVKAIYENKQRKASLAQSVGIVYPAKAAAGLDGSQQMIAILDSGVDKNHSFFKTNGVTRVKSEACYSGGNLTRFSEIDSLCPGNATRSTASGSGEDCTGYIGCDHGTHVAGIAAGNGGVASGANILAIQVFTGIRDLFNNDLCKTGPGTNCISAFDSDIIAGLERVFALRNTFNIAAVNMSLGFGKFGGSCNSENNLVTNIIGQLKSAGIATVVASGNDGFSSDIGFPACISNAIAVGATSDFTGDIFGNPVTRDKRVFYSNTSSILDLYAPGTLINSSVPNGNFSNFNGTSMATPHVAGAFAVIQQGDPSLSVAQIESTLKSVGPNVTAGGVTRRRLDIKGALIKLGLFKVVTAPILLLLDD